MAASGGSSGLAGVLEVLQRALREAGGKRDDGPSTLHEDQSDEAPNNEMVGQLAWCVGQLEQMVASDTTPTTSADGDGTHSTPPAVARRRNSFQQIEAEEAQVRSSLAGDEHAQKVGNWMVSTYTGLSEADSRAKKLLQDRERSKKLLHAHDLSRGRERSKSLSVLNAPPSPTLKDSSIVDELLSIRHLRDSSRHPSVIVSDDCSTGMAPSPSDFDAASRPHSLRSTPDVHRTAWVRGFGLGAEHHPPHRASQPGEDLGAAEAPFAQNMLLGAAKPDGRISVCSSDDGFLRQNSTTSIDDALADNEVDPCIAEVNRLLSRVNKWNLDIFRLAELNAGSPLAVLGLRVLSERNLIHTLHLDKTKLINFLCRVEDSYRRFPEVQYHNNLHGADVMHSTHVLLSDPALEGAFSDLEVFTAIIAAAIHDVDHRGRTNAFLIKTRSPWATLYNDISVLENHHVSTAFRIMEDENCNILSGFNHEEFLVVRKLMIDMVLSTDMARHTKFLGEFKALIDARFSSGGGSSDEPGVMSIATQLSDSFQDRALVLCSVVHNADLANSAKEWPLAQKWTYRLMDEFCAEGDEERRQGLDLGPLNDRETMNIPKGQVGFINFIALPLWKAWGSYVAPRTQTVQLKHLKDNLKEWKTLIDTSESTPSSPQPSSPPETQDENVDESEAVNTAPLNGEQQSLEPQTQSEA